MKHNPIDEVSSLIDTLNESGSIETRESSKDQELDELINIAAKLKNMPEVDLPDKAFAQKVAGQIRAAQGKQSRLKKWFTPVGITAAGIIILLLLFSPWSLFSNRDVVLAMGEKVSALKGYHGTLAMRTITGDNQSWLVRRAEIWSQGEKYAIKDQFGVLTVNNGERKWQVQPQEKLITLLPVLPDPLQGRIDLREEGTKAMNYPHRVVGQEEVSGRQTAKVQISPPGGESYYLWIDNESKMPIQLMTAMQNSIQTVYTLLDLDINIEIPGDIFNYKPDPQYKVVEKGAGKLVGTLDEAGAIAGFNPLVPKNPPVRIWASENKIALDYQGTVLTETLPDKPMEIAPNASLGKANGEMLEVLGEKLRWQQKGIEFSVEGPKSLEVARQLVKVTLPDKNKDLTKAAKVKVSLDMEIVKNEQKQVDGGHSPWNLDPKQVSMEFINFELKAKPPVNFVAIKLEANTGSQAVCTVNNGPVKKIYLKRLVRQDETGIWTVVGYDPS